MSASQGGQSSACRERRYRRRRTSANAVTQSADPRHDPVNMFRALSFVARQLEGGRAMNFVCRGLSFSVFLLIALSGRSAATDTLGVPDAFLCCFGETEPAQMT